MRTIIIKDTEGIIIKISDESSKSTLKITANNIVMGVVNNVKNN